MNTHGRYYRSYYEPAYQALRSHPGWPSITASKFFHTALRAASQAIQKDSRSEPWTVGGNIVRPSDVYDGVMNHIADDRLSSIPLMRAIRNLKESWDFHTAYVEASREPNSADPPGLAGFLPEQFGTGRAGMQAVIDRVRTGRRDRTGDNAPAGFWAAIDRGFGGRRSQTGNAKPGPDPARVQDTRGASLLVITRSPNREYAAYAVFSAEGEVLLKDTSGVRPATPDALGNNSTIYALGIGPDSTILAGVPRPVLEPATGGSRAGTSSTSNLRGGAASPSELEGHPESRPAGEKDAVSGDGADVPGARQAWAVFSGWYGHPTSPGTLDLDATEGPIAQARNHPPEPVGHGLPALASVVYSLPQDHAAALLTVNAGEPTQRWVTVVRTRRQILLIDRIHGKHYRLTPDTLSSLGATYGEIHAAAFDTNHNPIPVSTLDDYQGAEHQHTEWEDQTRDNVAAGRDIQLPGTRARLVSWANKLYVMTKDRLTLPPETAADLAATLDLEIVALVMGADAEDPIRWMAFPPLGRPLPVKPEDLPPDARKALAELDQNAADQQV